MPCLLKNREHDRAAAYHGGKRPLRTIGSTRVAHEALCLLAVKRKPTYEVKT